MAKYKALALDPDHCLPNDVQADWNITFCPSATAEQLCASVAQEPADFVLLHLELPEGMSGLDLLSELRKHKPNIPAIVLTGNTPTDQMYLDAANKPFVQLMPTPVTRAKLAYHLSRLFEQTTRTIGAPQPARKALRINHVAELRNDQTGRLDADKISDVFGLPVSTIAKCIDKPRQTIEKTPDSIGIQPVLQNFERIAYALLVVTGSIKGLKMWLNSPNPEFDGHTPLDVIKHAKTEWLADWIDDARLGTPD